MVTFTGSRWIGSAGVMITFTSGELARAREPKVGWEIITENMSGNTNNPRINGTIRYFALRLMKLHFPSAWFKKPLRELLGDLIFLMRYDLCFYFNT
jgi:hypothetical protein